MPSHLCAHAQHDQLILFKGSLLISCQLAGDIIANIDWRAKALHLFGQSVC